MAKQQGEVNRSAAIRDYLGKHPSAPAKEVVDALGKKGITVTIGLVYQVKKELKKAEKKAAANGRKAEPAPAPASTAKASGDINKSEEIRTVLKATPAASVKEVVATLASKGITVTEALVYSVKQSLKKNKKKKGQPAGAMAVPANGHATNGAATDNPVHLILKVKALASAVGGIKSLKQLVDALVD